jgi:dihydroflavonol-4-reductase
MIGLTGGTGYLGNVIARSCIDLGRSFRALVRSEKKALSMGLSATSVVEGDLADPESLCRCFTDCDTVIHTAALISIDNLDAPELMNINLEGTQAVIDACIRSGVKRLVHVGSIEAFDLAGGCRIGADGQVDPDKAILAYGRSKAMAINRVLDINGTVFSTIVLSPTAIIGPYDYGPSPMGRFIRAFLRRRLPAYVNGGFDFVDVRDVASACLQATESGKPGNHYVLSGSRLDVLQLLELLEEVSGVRKPVFLVPDGVTRVFAKANVRLSRMFGRSPIITTEAVRLLSLSAVVDSRPAIKDLNYRPRDIRETLEDTVNWFRARTE